MEVGSVHYQLGLDTKNCRLASLLKACAAIQILVENSFLMLLYAEMKLPRYLKSLISSSTSPIDMCGHIYPCGKRKYVQKAVSLLVGLLVLPVNLMCVHLSSCVSVLCKCPCNCHLYIHDVFFLNVEKKKKKNSILPL